MYKPKALITGINGFVGSHLADLLVAKGFQVFGITLPSNLPHPESQFTLFYADILDAQEIKKIVSQVQPDYLYHLAGSAFVPDAEADPRFVYEVNVMGTLNLLEAVRLLKLKTRVLVVGSGEVYGRVPKEHLPVTEDYPLNPASPYGVTKACADLLASQYATSYQMDVIRVRPFNHIGPRQSEQFVCSSFAKQIVEIEKGIREPILLVGNLETYRDFTDVRDIIKAYHLICEGAKRGSVYNVGSNKAWKIGELVKILIGLSTIKEIALHQQQIRVRSNDIPILLCNPSKLKKDLGWKPEISMEQTLHNLLEYWREKIDITCQAEVQR